MASRVIHANFTNHDGEATQGNALDIGIIGNIPSILAVTLTGNPNKSFENNAHFTMPAYPNASGFVHHYTLNVLGVHGDEITDLSINVCSDTHAGKNILHTIFPVRSAKNLIGSLPAGPYHLDISGHLKSTAQAGRYSVALQALPIPEPRICALLLTSLRLAKLSARRRKFA